ncbi:AmmeMemoRadiSam system protein B [Spirochaeta thermophila]|uniref:Putative dioxygenase n=1 Tax=Winmispira thermophila (strain ATCC 49972 / DSM 6192 / RI 19.B1) TaxID=665571 RepID=E0RPB5_WINT6|nr:AmmeMemoRadiSam system protein B [Spirochaeta thermophila]ADN01309.1 putative dioxygenase [Spirochaeta thermophila DSM 6192]
MDQGRNALTQTEELVREPIVEGIFYPDAADALEARLDALLSRPSPESPPPRPFALIVPHATWDYVGGLLGTAFAHVVPWREHFRRVVLWGPTHREPFPSLFLPASTLFATPLGPLSLDLPATQEALASSTAFAVDDLSHMEEHCLEVVFPFLRSILPHAPILPVLVGAPLFTLVETLARALYLIYAAEWEHTLFVVSTNLTPFAPRKDNARRAEELIHTLLSTPSHTLLSRIRTQHNPEKPLLLIWPLLMLAEALELPLSFHLLGRETSPPEDGHTVEYASFLVTGGNDHETH